MAAAQLCIQASVYIESVLRYSSSDNCFYLWSLPCRLQRHGSFEQWLVHERTTLQKVCKGSLAPVACKPVLQSFSADVMISKRHDQQSQAYPHLGGVNCLHLTACMR